MQHTSEGQATAGNATRVALVSGAASGIGLATVGALTLAGWTVYAGFRPAGRSAPPQESFPHPQVQWLPLDVTDEVSRRGALCDQSGRRTGVWMRWSTTPESWRRAPWRRSPGAHCGR